MHKKKYFYKNPLNLYLSKVLKFHGDSVKNESERAKNYKGGTPNATPPPGLCRVKKKNDYYLSSFLKK